jgi:hypothetical protein
MNGFSPWMDSNWVGDVTTKQFTLSYIFLLGNGFISLQSQKKDTMTLSTSEVEYVVDVTTTKESQWLCQILQDWFSQHNPTTFFCNNKSIIKLSKNI